MVSDYFSQILVCLSIVAAFFLIGIFIELIVDSRTVVRNNIEPSLVYFVWVQLLFFASTVYVGWEGE